MTIFIQQLIRRPLARICLAVLTSYSAVAQSDTIAYYTFTGDTAGWTTTDLSVQTTGDDWVWSDTGPTGAFTIDPIESTTSSGGYLLFDSDALCSGSQNARIQSPVLDFSLDSVVELRWQQRYRRFESAVYVEVSRDGGQTFAPFELSPALMNDEFTGSQNENPDFVRLDISPVAAGEANVVVAFRFFSEESIFGPEAGCGYAWMIDDVALANAIAPPAQNDLAIVPGSHAGAANRITPSQQVEALNLGARVVNHGVNAASGMLHVSIFDASGMTPVLIYTDSVEVPVLAQGEESNFLLLPGRFTPEASPNTYIGRYELRVDDVLDEVEANNMARFDFSISESFFAKTNGPALYARPQASESWGFGNVYDLQGTDNELSRILFWLRPVGDFSSATSDSIFVEVYDIAGDTNDDGDYADAAESNLLSRQGYSIAGLEEPTRFFVTPQLDTGLSISDLTSQIAVFVRYEDGLAGDSRWVEIGGGRDNAHTNYDAEQSAALLNNIDREFAIRSIGDGPLLSSLFPGFIPDVRAYVNENRTVHTESAQVSSGLMSVWPNPVSDRLHLSLDTPIANAAGILKIVTARGRLVKTEKFDEIQDVSEVNVAWLPSGLYYLSIKMNDGFEASQRIIKL